MDKVSKYFNIAKDKTLQFIAWFKQTSKQNKFLVMAGGLVLIALFIASCS